MKKSEIIDEANPTCPIRNVISRFGDKWSILVLLTLKGFGVQRFKELQKNIPDISQKMLTETLRTLEADGLILRKAYPEVPPRVEYNLSERANTLIPLLNSLVSWASSNMDDIINDRRTYQKKSAVTR